MFKIDLMSQKLIYVAILIIISVQLKAQSKFSFPAGKKEAKISFDLKSNLIIVPVLINNVKLNFLVDTGVNFTLIFDNHKAKQLGLSTAVLGGANRVMNHSYDLRFNQPNAFGDRIARNQLHLLKYESYFDELPNVMDGSYYLEALQEEMKEKAWALFLEIEQHGGWLTAIETNNIQSKIEKARQEEARQFKEGALVLVGTNKYTTASSLNAEIKAIVPRAAKKKAMFTPLETFYLS